MLALAPEAAVGAAGALEVLGGAAARGGKTDSDGVAAARAGALAMVADERRGHRTGGDAEGLHRGGAEVGVWDLARLGAGLTAVGLPADAFPAGGPAAPARSVRVDRGSAIADPLIAVDRFQLLAVEEAGKQGVSVCYTDITKKRWAELLGDAYRQGDHGGAFETSLMMAAAPDQVRERERISLPPTDGLVAAMKKGAKTFLEAGGEDAYFGDPTAASAEEGEAYFEALAEVLSLSVMEHLGSKA